jgi:deazaflavin-dependent oxidoreductase (nitroreductase family)
VSATASVLRRLGHKKWFASVGRVFVPVDRALLRITKGKINAVGRSSLPTLLLTTIGAKSGLERTVPLMYCQDGDGFIVTASNWGQAHHPAWSANLIANPEATMDVGGRAVPVSAELAEGPLREQLWTKVTQVWPAYDTYEERSGRSIRVFRLTPR